MQPRTMTLPNIALPADPQRHEASSAVRSAATDWRWSRPTLGGILLLAAFFNLFKLDHEGYSNSYYAAAIRSMVQNWHNFFFVSFDPGGYVSVDKPPLGFWIEAAFARAFGFGGVSTILPQALAGVLAVALLYHLVARGFGAPAGLIAALALAVSPISVVANRNNTIDSQLVLVVLLAAWAALRATESGHLRPLLACAVLIGLGFNIKMMQAYLVVPACGLVYLLAAPRTLGARLAHLTLAAIVLLVVSFGWIAAVDLTPASQRPYVGSTCNNSELNLALGYNGLGRLTGGIFSACSSGSSAAGEAGGGITTGEIGSAGPLRLLNRELGGQIGWLLPLALVGLVVGATQTRLRLAPDRERRRLILDGRQQSLLIWGAWLATCAAFFSVADFFHTYYLVMLAPSIAALSGIGAAALWQEYRRTDGRRWLLPASLIGVALVQAILLRPFPDWNHWLTPLIVGLSVLSALILAARGLLRRFGPRLGLAAGVVGLGALLAAPTTWAAYSVDRASGGSLPRAGPAAAIEAGATSGFPGGGFPGAPGAAGAVAQGQVDRGLLRYLEKNQGATRYLLTVSNANNAAPFILATGKPVMALGGFLGSDPILTTGKLASLIKDNTVRYFQLMGGGFGGGRPPAALLEQLPAAMREMIEARGGKGIGGFGSDHGLSTWVAAHCAPVPASAYQAPGTTAPSATAGGFGFGGGQLYDCDRRPAAPPAGVPGGAGGAGGAVAGSARGLSGSAGGPASAGGTATSSPLPALRRALAAVVGYQATATTTVSGLGGAGGPGGGATGSTATLTAVRRAHGFAEYVVATGVNPLGKTSTETTTYDGKSCARSISAGPFTCKAATTGGQAVAPAGVPQGGPSPAQGNPPGAQAGQGASGGVPGGQGGLPQGVLAGPQLAGDPGEALAAATFSEAAPKMIAGRSCDGYAYRSGKAARGTLYLDHATRLPCEQDATTSVPSPLGSGSIEIDTITAWSRFNDPRLRIPSSPVT